MSTLISQTELEERKAGKDLYSYQKGAINKIFTSFEESPADYHLLYQLPTGGGKTVIFSEIVRQYLKIHKKKVLVMTHRIELCKQTSRVLTEFGVDNKVVDSKADLSDQADYSCFVAMVETLNNRLNDDKLDISDIGLVIIDEAHYNSFTKLFKFFSQSFILGVTATPLSSSMELPMTDNYDELIVGESIESLIENGFLARAEMFSYNVGLTSLVVGANGDYTVKSSEDLYTANDMLSKLLQAYEERAKGKKTLIFNNGINTSLHVYDTFKRAGYAVAHLDNTNSKKERALILKWFKETPDAILTSVSIILDNKKTFNVIDLGNNFHRFGAWGEDLDWQRIFRSPNYYLDAIISDEELENNFRYEMPDALRAEFSKSKEVYFDIQKTYVDSIKSGESSKVVLERSIEQHAKICIENSEDVYDALALAKMLGDDIDFRIQRYTKCISKSTYNFVDWLKGDYRKKLNAYLRSNFDEVFEKIHGHPPED